MLLEEKREKKKEGRKWTESNARASDEASRILPVAGSAPQGAESGRRTRPARLSADRISPSETLGGVPATSRVDAHRPEPVYAPDAPLDVPLRVVRAPPCRAPLTRRAAHPRKEHRAVSGQFLSGLPRYEPALKRLTRSIFRRRSPKRPQPADTLYS